MKIISLISPDNIEYKFCDHKIEWKEKIKTKTHIIDTYVINDSIIVVSEWKIKFVCEKCQKETIILYSNFKKKKSDICLNCQRSINSKGKILSQEQKNKISKRTKEAMSKFSEEKKLEINKKRIENTNWEKRNTTWLKTMSQRTEEEKMKSNEKISNSLKNRWQASPKSWLTKEYTESNYSTIDCKYFTRGVHSTNEKILVECDKCHTLFETTRGAAARKEKEHPGFIQCFNCSCEAKSLKEKEVVNWLKLNGISDIIENSKKIISPLELDIYLPKYNLAIEFDGLFWHSEQNGVDKHYHLNKTNLCNEKNIQLIHIFEDEWDKKKEIVKSRLKNRLGLNNQRIGGRECIIKIIDTNTKNNFLKKYHLQGDDKSNIKIGAFYENNLIAVMTFAKNRKFTKKQKVDNEWELSRFATIDDTYTPGVANKMLKFFEKNYNPISIYSYADKRWSLGNLYYKLGFELECETPPNYWYAKNSFDERHHRYDFKKSSLIKFQNYSEEKSEFQIMDELGYLRIWDCGNYKFIKK